MMIWYFLFYGLSGGYSTDLWVTAGPFKNQEQCEQLKKAIEPKIRWSTPCWDISK